jgi:hypothetical protein
MNEILIASIGAFAGFILSQAVDLIKYLRRPRFRVVHHTSGIMSSYTGDPPETPWEIELGFYLENFGKNPAKNMRIFLADLEAAQDSTSQSDSVYWEFSELKKPVEILPPREAIKVQLGVVRSDSLQLSIPFENDADQEFLWSLEADTRAKQYFKARFFIICDDQNVSQKLIVEFKIDSDEWASEIFLDHEEHVALGVPPGAV